MTKVKQNRPYRAQVPEGYEAHGWQFELLTLMAFVAERRYHRCRLTEPQWAYLLRRMRFEHRHIAHLQARLSDHYPQPLSFDEWHDLFKQMAIVRVLTAKHLDPW